MRTKLKENKCFFIRYISKGGIYGNVFVNSKNLNGAVRKFMQEYEFKEIKIIESL